MVNNDWINQVIEDTMRGKQFKRRIQSGIDHLEGRKLYKYYSFSSYFTIPNIKNGTIYLQNPVVFNDPFECNIGMSVNQLIRAIMPDFFDKILPDTNADVRDALSSWMFGGDAPELEEGSAEHLLAICAGSPVFSNMLDKAKNGQDVSDQEILSLVVEDPTTFSEMIKAYLTIVSKGDTLSFDNVAMQHIIKSPQVIRGLITSVAEIKDTKERQILELLTSKDDFIEKIKSIAAIAGVDVPKADIERVYSTLDDGIRQIREGLGKQVGIECFTQSPTDILMWSYYADKHTGVCVEYDFSKLFTTCANSFLFPVQYSENRPLLDIQNLFDPSTQQVYNDRIVEAFPSVMKSWITKSKEWEREKEWRLITFPIKSDLERLVKLPIASRIITGINITDENYQLVADIAKEKGIPIHRTRLKNDQYKIEVINE